MGKQYNKVVKRRRRLGYLKRKHSAARPGKKAPTRTASATQAAAS